MTFISSYQTEIAKLCSQHQVEKMYVFGSAATDKLKNDSDIDLLVKFRPFDLSQYFLNYMTLKDKLKQLLNRDIDLLEEQTLKNPFLIRSIDKNKELIYG